MTQEQLTYLDCGTIGVSGRRDNMENLDPRTLVRKFGNLMKY
jgi:hypothetical protein